MISDFKITPLHWILTLSIAIILHLLLVVNFHQDHHGSVNKDEDNNKIIISLKKLKPAQVVETLEPVIQKPKQVEQPKVETVKPKKQKPKTKKQPVSHIKKVHPVKPIVEPVLEQKTSEVIPSKPVQRSNIKNKATAIPSKTNHLKAAEKQRYLTQLSIWLNKHKKYPTIARRRKLEGNLTIIFVIDRHGRLLRHAIVEPSAHESLNRAAVKMLERASPMPEVPSSLIENRTEFEFSIPVNFKLSHR